MGPVLIAGLAFLSVTSVVFVLWWVFTSERALQARLTPQGQSTADSSPTLLRTDGLARFPLMEQLSVALPWIRRLEQLTEEAGWTGRSGQALGLIVLFAIIGGV